MAVSVSAGAGLIIPMPTALGITHGITHGVGGIPITDTDPTIMVTGMDFTAEDTMATMMVTGEIITMATGMYDMEEYITGATIIMLPPEPCKEAHTPPAVAWAIVHAGQHIIIMPMKLRTEA